MRTSESKESRLYCRYPHEEANIDDGTKMMMKGRWSDIKLVSGVRWVKQYREEIVNLFEWDESVTNSLENSKNRGSMIDKKEKMVSFLFETILGVCIAPNLNVSSNPSFECFNGRFKS